MLRQGARARRVELSEAAPKRAEAVRAGRHPPHEGELPAHLRGRADCGRVPRKVPGTVGVTRRFSSGLSRNISSVAASSTNI